MQPYQQRVFDEMKELEGRLDKLLDFLGSEIYKDLPEADRILLLSQRDFMRGYLNILNHRIARFA